VKLKRLSNLRLRCELCAERTGPLQPNICASCLELLTLLPSGCRICAEPLPPVNIAVCGACLDHPPAYERLTAPFLYADPLRRLIAEYKYRGRLHLTALFGELMVAAFAQAEFRPPSVIIPVPLHTTRLRERGFNQAHEIAKPLSHDTKIPIASGAVQRLRHTPPQQGLSAKGRLSNIRQAFAVREDFSGARVLIVDDVVTTGATINELAASLKRAGATSVTGLALARATTSSWR